MEKSENCRNIFTFLEKATEPASDADSFSSISSLEEEHKAPVVKSEKIPSKQDSRKRSHKSSSKDHSSQNGKQSLPHKSSKQSSKTDKGSDVTVPQGSTETRKYSSSGNRKDLSSGKRRHSTSGEHGGSTSQAAHKLSSSHQHGQSPERHTTHSADTGKASPNKNTCGKLKERRSSSSSNKDHSHKNHNRSYKHIYDIPLIINDTSGYVTSPDISSEEEDETTPASPEQQQDSVVAPVELSRHALKPTLDRYGGSSSERSKILAKLEAIRDQMNSNEAPAKKRAARGEVKRRRAKREFLEGDFTGSCMDKIEYNEEEKPSLKRPEPKPEPVPQKPEKPPKPKKMEKPKKPDKPKRSEKEKKEEKRRKEKQRKKSEMEADVDTHIKPRHRKWDDKKRVKSEKLKERPDSGSHTKFKQFHEAREKTKPRQRHQPPPVSFTELMKLAEQKQAKPGHTSADKIRHGADDRAIRPTSSKREKTAPFQERRMHGSSSGKPSPQSGSTANISSIRNVWDSLFSKSDKDTLKETPVSQGRQRVPDAKAEEEAQDHDDMADFIDDGEEECGTNVRDAIRQITGYDRRKFHDDNFDDKNMEVGFSQIMKEEARSARIGHREDLEDIRMEQEALKHKAAMKKMRKS